MKIPIPKTKTDLEKLMRRLDYQLDRKNNSDEIAFYRRMRSGRFPRFHIYIAEKKNKWIFKLHLDQKPHSYEGQTAHAGEYESSTVKEEANRIKHGVAAVLKEEKESDNNNEVEDIEKKNWLRIPIVGLVLALIMILIWHLLF